MAHMSSNVESPGKYFGHRSQLTNCILDSGATCHMKQEISDLIRAHWWEQINILNLQMGIY